MRSRMREQLKPRQTGRVAVIVAVKGADTGLAENLLPLLDQDHDDYKVIFVVESREDPAHDIIQRLIESAVGGRARLVVAGRTTDSGQKVHNLLAATANLDDETKLLAFVDADARPPKAWLRTLVCRLHHEGTGAATGYQWFMPQQATLSNRLMSSTFAGVCAMLGKHNFNLISGSSWAVSRKVFERQGLRDAWQGTLSDDLVASRVIRGAGMRVEFEPNCLCPAEGDVSFSQMIEFMRRQFVILKRYTPKHWAMSLISSTIMQIAFWGNIAAAVVLLASGRSTGLLHAGVALALYAMGAARGWLRQDAARRRFPEHHAALARARGFDIWGGCIASLLSWLVLAASAVGNTIRWRGNRYRILRGGRIQFLGGDNEMVDAASAQAERRAA